MEANHPHLLVIGATGQLGSAILQRATLEKWTTTAFVRSQSRLNLPEMSNVTAHIGDLSDFGSVDKACSQGITHVVATASSIVPRKGEAFGVDDLLYYRNIIRACQTHGIQHLIYISAFPSPFDEQIPEFVIKRQVEQMIIESGIPYTIFRGAAFMDIYYAVMGSSAVMKGIPQPTLLRGYWLSRLWSSLTNGILEKYGVALVPGNGQTRQSFICIEDVANCMVRAINQPATINKLIDLGGPQALSWREVADIYGEKLDKKVTKLPLPIWLLKLLEFIMRKHSPAGANMMSILALLGQYEFTPDMTELSGLLDMEFTDTRSFISRKLAEGE